MCSLLREGAHRFSKLSVNIYIMRKRYISPMSDVIIMETESVIATSGNGEISGEVEIPNGGEIPFESSKREPAWMGDGDDNYWS